MEDYYSQIRKTHVCLVIMNICIVGTGGGSLLYFAGNRSALSYYLSLSLSILCTFFAGLHTYVNIVSVEKTQIKKLIQILNVFLLMTNTITQNGDSKVQFADY